MFSKKFLGAALSLVLAAATTVPALAATGFSDVKDTDSLASVAQRLNSLGIMQGVKHNDGTVSFDGASTFTRAQAAKVFVVAKGLGKVQAKTGKFTDVTKDNWAYSVINVAAQYGIVNGTSDTTFAPKDEVTYGQLAAMAIRTLGYTEDDLDGSTFPYNYVQKAADLGLLDGIDSLDVDAPAPRADVAKVVDAMLNAKTKTQQAAYDAVVAAGNTYKGAASFFESVAGKFGVTKIAGAQIQDTSLVDSSLKANQFKLNAALTQVYTLPATYDVSGNLYQKAPDFYVDKNDNSKVLFFSQAAVSGSVVDGYAVNDIVVPASTDTTTAGQVYQKDSNGNAISTSYKTLLKDAKIFVNGSSTGASLNNLKPAGTTVTARLISTDGVKADGSIAYNAVVATVVNDPVKVVSAPSSDTVSSTGFNALTVVDPASATGATKPVSLMKDSTTASAVYVTGNATKLTEIKPDDIVYVSQTADKASTKLDVYRNTVKGTVSRINSDGSVVIGSTTCQVAKYVVNGTATSDTSVRALALGDAGTFVLDKSGKIVKSILDSSVTPTSYNGFVTAYQVAAPNGWDVTSWTYNVKVFGTDGTTQVLKSKTDLGNAIAGKLITYTKNSDGTVNVTPVTGTVQYSLNKAKITADTYAIKMDASSPAVVKASTLSIADATQLYTIGNGNAFGDFAVIAYAPTAAVTATNTNTNLTLIGAGVGTELSNSVTVNVYNAFENGTAKTLKFVVKDANGGVNYPTISRLEIVSGYQTDANGFVTAVTAVTPITGKAVAKDATRIQVGSTIYNLDSAVKVFVSTKNSTTDTLVAGSLSDITADATSGSTVDIVLNSSSNVALIVVEKN